MVSHCGATAAKLVDSAADVARNTFLLTVCSDADVTVHRSDDAGTTPKVETLGSCAYPALQLDAAPRETSNIFVGPLAGGRWAALLFNRADGNATLTLDFGLLPRHAGLSGLRRGRPALAGAGLVLEATEVWTGAVLGIFGGTLKSRMLQPHESLFVILAPKTASVR